MPNSNALSLFRRLIDLALSGFCLVILPGFCSLSGLPVGFHVRVASQLALHSISSGKEYTVSGSSLFYHGILCIEQLHHHIRVG